jgi:hypothetical protein
MRLASGLLAFSLVTSPVLLFAQSPAASAWQPLSDQADRYHSLAEDLEALGRDTSSELDPNIVPLATVANSAAEYLTAGGNLLYLYAWIVGPESVKSKPARLVRLTLQHYADVLAINSEDVNRRLTYIHAPGRCPNGAAS